MKNLAKNALSILCAFLMIFSLSLLAGCGLFGGSEYDFTYRSADKYTAGNTEIDDEYVSEHLFVRWYQGNVTVKTHDKDTIIIQEEINKQVDDKYKVHWWYSPEQTGGTTLFVEFCASEKLDFSGITKNLTITIPRTDGNHLSFDTDSANVTVDTSDFDNTLSKLSFATNEGSLNAKIDSADEVKISGCNDETDKDVVFELTSLGKVYWLGMNSSYAKVKATLNEVSTMDVVGSVYKDTEFFCNKGKKVKLTNSNAKIVATVLQFDSIEISQYAGQTVLNLPADSQFSATISRAKDYGEIETSDVVQVDFENVTKTDNVYKVGDGAKPISIKTAQAVYINKI